MSTTYIPVVVRRLVQERANYRCEYCQLPAGVAFLPMKLIMLLPKSMAVQQMLII